MKAAVPSSSLGMDVIALIETDGLDAIDAVVAALIVGVVMAASTCYFAISVSRRGYGKFRNSMLIASGVLCGLSVGFAFFAWHVIEGAS